MKSAWADDLRAISWIDTFAPDTPVEERHARFGRLDLIESTAWELTDRCDYSRLSEQDQHFEKIRNYLWLIESGFSLDTSLRS